MLFVLCSTLNFAKLVIKKETYNRELSGRRIIRVRITFWCLWGVCKSFMERISQAQTIVNLYGTLKGCNHTHTS